MASNHIIGLGLFLDIAGVIMIAIAIVSGRKGRLNDLQTSMKKTIGFWDEMLSSYERDLKRSYPENIYAKIIEELKEKREA